MMRNRSSKHFWPSLRFFLNSHWRFGSLVALFQCSLPFTLIILRCCGLVGSSNKTAESPFSNVSHKIPRRKLRTISFNVVLSIDFIKGLKNGWNAWRKLSRNWSGHVNAYHASAQIPQWQVPKTWSRWMSFRHDRICAYWNIMALASSTGEEVLLYLVLLNV